MDEVILIDKILKCTWMKRKTVLDEIAVIISFESTCENWRLKIGHDPAVQEQ